MSLSRELGQQVRIERVGLELDGSVSLYGISAGHASRPWLQVRSVKLDLNILTLITGKLEARRCKVSGLAAVIERHADGSIKTADLWNEPAKREDSRGDQRQHPPAPPEIVLELVDGAVRVIDQVNHTDATLTNIELAATYRTGRLAVDRLKGSLAGGTIELAAVMAGDGDELAVEGELRLGQVELGQGLGCMSFISPFLQCQGSAMDGQLDLDLCFETRGKDATELEHALRAEGHVVLSELPTSRAPFAARLVQATGLSAGSSLLSCDARIRLHDRRVTSAPMRVHLGHYPVVLNGWSDFDGEVDYSVESPQLARALAGIADRLPEQAREALSDLRTSKSIENAVHLRVRGSASAPSVSIVGTTTGTEGAEVIDRKRLRDLAERFWRSQLEELRR